MRRSLIPLLALVLLAFCAPRAEAQVQFGAQVSLADDVDLGVGVRARFSLDQYVERLTGVASFDLFFPDRPSGVDFTYWELNINGHYPLAMEGMPSLAPYFGGGLNIAHASVEVTGFPSQSDTDFGLNALIGTTFGSSGSLTPFVEIRLELGGGEQFVLCGGVNF